LTKKLFKSEALASGWRSVLGPYSEHLSCRIRILAVIALAVYLSPAKVILADLHVSLELNTADRRVQWLRCQIRGGERYTFRFGPLTMVVCLSLAL